MLDDLMGQSNAMQEKMQAELASKSIEVEKDGVKIIGNGTGEITDISLSEDVFKGGDKEMLEDLLLACFNEYKHQSDSIAQEASSKMLNDMLSGGLGNLFG